MAAMSAWWSYIKERLRSSLWVIPLVSLVLAGILAELALSLDRTFELSALRSLRWIYPAGPEGARLVLSTIATSVVSISGVTFSITVVALTLASNQFGPRLLRNYMRDRSTQTVLGIFLGTFLYCLAVIASIGNNDKYSFTPSCAVTGSFILSILSLFAFIYFVHNIATSMQAEQVIKQVWVDVRTSIDRLFPNVISEGGALQENNQAAGAISIEPPEGAKPQRIESKATGYVEAIDLDGLVELAKRAGVRLRLFVRPGQFVGSGAVIAVSDSMQANHTEIASAVRQAIVIGPMRTHIEDAAFGIHQLVEIAIRALSPGINDPFTAIACTRYLGTALRRLGVREFPGTQHFDDQQTLRVQVPALSYEDYLQEAFEHLWEHVQGSETVRRVFLETLATLRSELTSSKRRECVLRFEQRLLIT